MQAGQSCQYSSHVYNVTKSQLWLLPSLRQSCLCFNWKIPCVCLWLHMLRVCDHGKLLGGIIFVLYICDTITIRLYLLHYPMPAWRCLAHSPNITLTTITTTNSCTSQLNRLGRCKQYQGLSGKIWSQWRACTISFLCTVCVYNGKLQSPGDTFVAVDDCNIWQVSIAHRIHYVCILCMCNSCSCKLQHTS